MYNIICFCNIEIVADERPKGIYFYTKKSERFGKTNKKTRNKTKQSST